MGYDAFVYAIVLKKKKLKPGPPPTEDLYIDAGGFYETRFARSEEFPNMRNIMYSG